MLILEPHEKFLVVQAGGEKRALLTVLELVNDDFRQVLGGLKACGLLRASDKLLTRAWMPIKCGYVVYDFNRTPAVETIFKHLGKLGVESIGRYGGWKYSFMEETILDGARCADRLARG